MLHFHFYDMYIFSMSVFFGEEFQFDIPREFRFLSFYLYDRDRPMKTDKIMGKVSIKKDDLHKYHGKDQWFPITPVDADSEVQVKWRPTFPFII